MFLVTIVIFSFFLKYHRTQTISSELSEVLTEKKMLIFFFFTLAVLFFVLVINELNEYCPVPL